MGVLETQVLSWFGHDVGQDHPVDAQTTESRDRLALLRLRLRKQRVDLPEGRLLAEDGVQARPERDHEHRPGADVGRRRPLHTVDDLDGRAIQPEGVAGDLRADVELRAPQADAVRSLGHHDEIGDRERERGRHDACDSPSRGGQRGNKRHERHDERHGRRREVLEIGARERV